MLAALLLLFHAGMKCHLSFEAAIRWLGRACTEDLFCFSQSEQGRTSTAEVQLPTEQVQALWVTTQNKRRDRKCWQTMPDTQALTRRKKSSKKFKSQFVFRQDVKWPLSRGRRREHTTVLGPQVSPSASTGHNTVGLPKAIRKMFGASHCAQH